MTERYADLAAMLGAARAAATGLPPVPAPGSVDEGYAAQAALGAWFAANGHGPRVGWKIGATTPRMQAILGADGPSYGRVRAANVHRDGARFDPATLCKPAVEPELALRLGRDLDPGDAPWTRQEIARLVDAVAPAIELVENRYGDIPAFDLPTLIADDFLHRACVLGDFVPIGELPDLATLTAELAVNGQVVGTGAGAAVLGHPLQAVVWLGDRFAAEGRVLRKGDFVLTGSITPLHWITEAPAAVEARIAGLPTLRAVFG
jgi:2-keto-4-pentenoate hydratase